MYTYIDKAAYGEHVEAGDVARYPRRPCSSIQSVSIVYGTLVRVQPMRQTFLVVVMVLTMALAVLLGIAIWPYLHYLGIAATFFGVVLFACLSLLALASTWHLVGILRARKQRERLHARVIIAGDIVIMPDGNGGYAHLSAEHEAAKLALPAPIITEIKEDDALKRSKILDLRAKGRTLLEIVDELHIPYNQVQRICAAATNLVIEK